MASTVGGQSDTSWDSQPSTWRVLKSDGTAVWITIRSSTSYEESATLGGTMTWEARNSERDPNAWDVFSDEGVLLFRGTWERDGARAKLAAAAPELLAALKLLVGPTRTGEDIEAGRA